MCAGLLSRANRRRAAARKFPLAAVRSGRVRSLCARKRREPYVVLILALSSLASCGDTPHQGHLDPKYVVPGRLLAAFPTADSLGLLGRARGLDVVGERVFVADPSGPQVLVFHVSGSVIGSFGRRGEGPGELLHPTHVKGEADGSFWVGDRQTGRISKFDKTGQYEVGITVPSPAFAIAGDTLFLAGGEPGAFGTALVDLQSTVSLGVGSRAFSELGAAIPPSAAGTLFLIAHSPRFGAIYLDNMFGQMGVVQSVSPEKLEELALPTWLHARALEKQTARLGSTNVAAAAVTVPLFKSLHTSGDGFWLTAGWVELIGAWIPMDHGAAPLAVVPPASESFGLIRDAALVDDSTLVTLFDSEVRIYRLEAISSDDVRGW